MDDINQNYSVNEKLRSFTDMALREAYRKKKEIVDTVEIEVKENLQKTEIKLLEDAYHSIQTGTRQNRRELNEATSKALVDGKRKMFDKRKDIIEDVFRQVMTELTKYKSTTEYPVRLLEDLFECMKIIDDSNYVVEVDGNEEELFKKLVMETGIPAEITVSEDGCEGGFIIYGKIKRLRIDCSFKTRTAEAREKFLEMCRIPIEDGDLLNG